MTQLLPDLTVCQVRTETNAMILSLSMGRWQCPTYRQRQAEILDYIQPKSAAARRSHRKATRRRLHRLGIKISRLRRCQRE
jgi:hypothetical protein